MTAKRLPRPRDPAQLGKLIGDILTGQVEDLAVAIRQDSNDKDPAAVSLGRRGGLKGGKARAAKMTAKRRAEIARKPQKPIGENNASYELSGAANHARMMAIYFMHYNFVRIHQTLKVTPAMAAGVTSKLCKWPT